MFEAPCTGDSRSGVINLERFSENNEIIYKRFQMDAV